MLARNSDINGAVRSIRALEDRFNNRHGYPYVFLNDVPFTDEFKRRVRKSLTRILAHPLGYRRVSVLTASTVEFGVIPKEHWQQPDWIDEPKASNARHRMAAANVKYGGA
jgi:alpha 1,2-mannosyltransferase